MSFSFNGNDVDGNADDIGGGGGGGGDDRNLDDDQKGREKYNQGREKEGMV